MSHVSAELVATMCGASSVYRSRKRRTHFPQTSVPAQASDLDHDTAPAPVILSGPFATSLVNVPLSGVPGSVGPDLVDSI